MWHWRTCWCWGTACLVRRWARRQSGRWRSPALRTVTWHSYCTCGRAGTPAGTLPKLWVTVCGNSALDTPPKCCCAPSSASAASLMPPHSGHMTRSSVAPRALKPNRITTETVRCERHEAGPDGHTRDTPTPDLCKWVVHNLWAGTALTEREVGLREENIFVAFFFLFWCWTDLTEAVKKIKECRLWMYSNNGVQFRFI